MRRLAPAAGRASRVDCTLGWRRSRAGAFSSASRQADALLGLDVDPIELPRTEARLRARGFGDDVFVARRTNFAGLRAGAGRRRRLADGADFVFADLGVSSMQLDDPARGFTLQGTTARSTCA